MEDVQTTIEAYRTAAKQTAVWNLEVLIIIRPGHHRGYVRFRCGPNKTVTKTNEEKAQQIEKLRQELNRL